MMRPASDDAEALAELNARVKEFLVSRVNGKFYITSHTKAAIGETLCEAINKLLDELDVEEA